MSQEITARISSGDIRQFTSSVDRLGSRIDQVGNEVERVNNNLNVLQMEVLAQMGITIDRLTRQIEKTEEVRTEVERNTESAAQSLLIQTAGKIFSQVGLIASQRRRLREQFEKTIIRINRINEKYTKLNFNIEQSYHKDIVRLGKYIFDIWDLYTKAIEDRLMTRHSACFESIERFNEEIRNLRESLIRKNYDIAKEKVNSFFQDRKIFKESIDKLINSDMKEFKNYAVPFYINIESVPEKEVNIVVGEDINLDKTLNNPFILEKTDWFNDLRTSPINWEHSIEWREMEESEINDYSSLINSFQEKGYYSEEFKETFKLAFENTPPKVSKSSKKLIFKSSEDFNKNSEDEIVLNNEREDENVDFGEDNEELEVGWEEELDEAAK